MITTKRIWETGSSHVVTIERAIMKKLKLVKGDLLEIKLRKVKGK